MHEHGTSGKVQVKFRKRKTRDFMKLKIMKSLLQVMKFIKP
jgi:hypothetical protein